MLNFKKRKVMRRNLLIIICLSISSMIFASGCEPLRKKFTRKKKKTVKQEVPVLEPVEYPVKVYTKEGLYKHHFSLWQVWSKELLADMSGSSSSKRRLYLMEQAILNLEIAKDLLVDDEKQQLIDYLEKMKRIKRNFESPVKKSSISSIEIKLRSLGKKIRREFSFRNVEDKIMQ